MNRLIRRTSSLLLLVALVGCGDEGILIAVSGDDVDALRFHVGIQDGQSFVLDQGVSGLRVDVAGRRLRVNPYELMLEQQSQGDMSLRVFVLGLRRENNADTIYSFGLTEPPQSFIAGEVVRRAIALQTYSSSRSVAKIGSCYRMRVEDKVFTVVPNDDRDCDGSATPADCNDADSDIHPGTPEYCDGKDNNCDGKKAEAKVPCFAADGDTCRAGQRGCDEATGGGLAAECIGAGDPVPMTFCQAYIDCGAKDPQRCANSVTPRRRSCKLEQKPGGVSCGIGKIKLERPYWTDKCKWRIVSTGGFTASIADPAACTTELSIKAIEPGATGPVVVEFFNDGKATTVWEYAITMVDADPCSENPLTCN